jgi:hypothetical protein
VASNQDEGMRGDWVKPNIAFDDNDNHNHLMTTPSLHAITKEQMSFTS